jgi:exosortase/archaeosortase family protein
MTQIPVGSVGKAGSKDKIRPCRRQIVTWVSAILFCNYLLNLMNFVPFWSVYNLIHNVSADGVFQYMAWFAVFSLIFKSDPTIKSCRADFVVGVILCLFVFLPVSHFIWMAATGAAVYWYLSSPDDLNLRSAAIVLGALSVQELWGHILFRLLENPLLHAETAVVGSLLEVVRTGTVWHGNVVTGPDGYGIAIYEACSAFHNLSLAMLCWVTISNLQQRSWDIREFSLGALIGTVMILENVLRLCSMAWDIDSYHYWHDGAGSEVFAVGASLSVLAISLYASRSGAQTR